jgi:hypothetical protein
MWGLPTDGVEICVNQLVYGVLAVEYHRFISPLVYSLVDLLQIKPHLLDSLRLHIHMQLHDGAPVQLLVTIILLCCHFSSVFSSKTSLFFTFLQ